MVPSINKTSELVQEIAAASGEQAGSVNQITSAMGHLNGATQQNASASEELSATAEEMAAQAAQLTELMSFFRLQEPGSAKPFAAQAQARSSNNPGRRTAPTPRLTVPAHRAPSRSLDNDSSHPGPRTGRASAAALERGDIDETSFSSF
jgi:methyl-accepting chemotaxis protein